MLEFEQYFRLANSISDMGDSDTCISYLIVHYETAIYFICNSCYQTIAPKCPPIIDGGGYKRRKDGEDFS